MLEQIAKQDDYSEEIVTAALRSGLRFAVLEAAQLEVVRRAERFAGQNGHQTSPPEEVKVREERD